MTGEDERRNDLPVNDAAGRTDGPFPPNDSFGRGFGRFVGMTRSIGLAIFGVIVSGFVLLVYRLIALARAILHALFETAYEEAPSRWPWNSSSWPISSCSGWCSPSWPSACTSSPSTRPFPFRPRVTNLDGLTSQIINVVVVLLAVTFLAWVTDWDGDANVASFGGAIGFVIAALCLYAGVDDRGGHGPDAR